LSERGDWSSDWHSDVIGNTSLEFPEIAKS